MQSRYGWLDRKFLEITILVSQTSFFASARVACEVTTRGLGHACTAPLPKTRPPQTILQTQCSLLATAVLLPLPVDAIFVPIWISECAVRSNAALCYRSSGLRPRTDKQCHPSTHAATSIYISTSAEDVPSFRTSHALNYATKLSPHAVSRLVYQKFDELVSKHK